MQESGRAGRDGNHRFAYIICKGLMLNHIEKYIKKIVKTSECRRRTLMKHFCSSKSRLEGGGVPKNNHSGTRRPDFRPLTLLYTIFDRKGTPFVYLPLNNGTSFVDLPLSFSRNVQ